MTKPIGVVQFKYLDTKIEKPFSLPNSPAIKAGTENKTEAKITGMTPAEFNLKGIQFCFLP